MKSLFLLVAVFFQLRVFAGYDNTAPKAWASDLSAQSLAQQQIAFAQQESERKYQAALIAAQQAELTKIYSKDPWRKIGSNTNLARGDGWLEFQGSVQEPLENGVVFKGKYGQILTIHTDPSYSDHLVQKVYSSQIRQKSGSTTQTTIQQDQETSLERRKVYGDDLFYVEDFPYPAEKSLGYEQMMALDGDYYSYTNSRNQLITIRKLV